MSQKIEVLKHLQAGKSLTQEQAIAKWRCFRLPVMIQRLRDEGHMIAMEWVPNRDNMGRHGKYSLMVKQ